jgi:hypothetical protein
MADGHASAQPAAYVQRRPIGLANGLKSSGVAVCRAVRSDLLFCPNRRLSSAPDVISLCSKDFHLSQLLVLGVRIKINHKPFRKSCGTVPRPMIIIMKTCTSSPMLAFKFRNFGGEVSALPMCSVIHVRTAAHRMRFRTTVLLAALVIFATRDRWKQARSYSYCYFFFHTHDARLLVPP